MHAVLWISNRCCRVLVYSDGDIIDTCDEWNNRASAQSWVLDAYPTAILRNVRDAEEIERLDREWAAYHAGAC